MKITDRMTRLGTESAFEVLAKAQKLEAAGQSVIHLEIGEPDFDTPEHIVEAGIKALRDGYTHYSPSPGIGPLRQAIADHISRTRHIAVTSDQVIVTPGVKPIMFFTMLALAQEGDEVIFPDPGYPIYESMIRFVGAKPVPVSLTEKFDFGLDVDQLRSLVTPRTKLIILNSPHNPTGSALTQDSLKEIAQIACENDLAVMSDEIYSEMLYGGKYHSIIQFPGMQERTILMDGFSKTYAMTGWRLGYGVMPAELAIHIGRLVTNSVSCTATFVQKAGIAALTGPEEPWRKMIAEFKLRREVIVDGLNAIKGIRCRRPAGAFYVFPNVTGIGLDSNVLADRLLREAGVAVLSGAAFGHQGAGYLRLSYANSIQNINEALARIDRFVSSL